MTNLLQSNWEILTPFNLRFLPLIGNYKKGSLKKKRSETNFYFQLPNFNWRILCALCFLIHQKMNWYIVKMALTFKVHRNIWLTEGTLYASWNGFCYFTENSSKYCVEHLLLKDNRFFYVYHQFHWHRNAQEHMAHT